MKKIILFVLVTSQLAQAQKADKLIKEKEVKRIIYALTDDTMNGRSAYDEKSIFKAAAFIEKEFQKTGLKPLLGTNSFLQEFTKEQIIPEKAELIIDGEKITGDKFILVTEKKEVN